MRLLWVFLLMGMGLSGCAGGSKYRAKTVEAETLRSENEALQTQFDTFRSTSAAREKELSAKIIGLEKRIEALAPQAEKVPTLEARAQELEELAKQKEGEIAKLKGTYESLVGDLKKEISDGEIQIIQLKDKLTVNLVEAILFNSGEAQVKPQGKKILDRVGEILKKVSNRQIRIEGHTDNVPISEERRAHFPTNWELSTARATQVTRYLQEKVKIDPRFLSAVGYGPFKPISDNKSPSGRAKNRRIEIVLVPLEGPIEKP